MLTELGQDTWDDAVQLWARTGRTQPRFDQHRPTCGRASRQTPPKQLGDQGLGVRVVFRCWEIKRTNNRETTSKRKCTTSPIEGGPPAQNPSPNKKAAPGTADRRSARLSRHRIKAARANTFSQSEDATPRLPWETTTTTKANAQRPHGPRQTCCLGAGLRCPRALSAQAKIAAPVRQPPPNQLPRQDSKRKHHVSSKSVL